MDPASTVEPNCTPDNVEVNDSCHTAKSTTASSSPQEASDQTSTATEPVPNPVDPVAAFEQEASDDSDEEVDYTADPLYDAKRDADNEKWFEKRFNHESKFCVYRDQPNLNQLRTHASLYCWGDLCHALPPSGLPGMDANPTERRIDAADGRPYSKAEFLSYYGRLTEWSRSKVAPNTSGVQNPSPTQRKKAVRGKSKKRRRITLTCPCCFTLLCADSQQHAEYSNQFRAMFTINCKVVMEEKIIHKLQPEPPRSNTMAHDPGTTPPRPKSAEPSVAPTMPSTEILHPVLCDHCQTEVGVFDEDSVYHFFEVIPT